MSDAVQDDKAGTATDPDGFHVVPSSEYAYESVRVTFVRRRYWHHPFESATDHVNKPEPVGSAWDQVTCCRSGNMLRAQERSPRRAGHLHRIGVEKGRRVA